ncbi:L-2-amino-thiazoline-4-carboxylic acid hydrolase [Candidatus Bipolaricaulota bacterium]
MEARSYRSYAGDSTIALTFSKFAPRLIESLDQFVEFIGDRQPEILSTLKMLLLKLTRAATVEDLPARDPAICEQLLACSCGASQFPDLLEAHYDLLRGLLGIDESSWVNGERIELSQGRFIRARFLPNYLKLKALAEAIGRDDAIELMKQFLDETIALSPARQDGPKCLAELRERQIEFNLQEAGMDWISAVVSEHQYLNKVTVCRIQKVLAEYDDNELMEVVACYPDFAMFRKTNEYFCLSRTQTLMNGGDYCDSCYHDERFVAEFEHPSADVFTRLSEDDG